MHTMHRYAAVAGLAAATALPRADAAVGIPDPDCQVLPTLRHGGALDDEIRAALRDPQGNLWFAGYLGGRDAARHDWPQGDSSAFIEKRRPDGRLIWRRTLDTTGVDVIDAIAPYGRGGIVAAGRTTGALPGQANGGQTDTVVLVFDAKGGRRAALQFGDERPQHPVGVVALPSGDVVVAGYDDAWVEGRALLDNENGFIARLARGRNGTFALAWQQRAATPAADRITALAAAGAGSEDVFVAAHVVAAPTRGGGVALQRLDAAGRAVWSAPVSSSPSDQITALAATPEGRLYGAGASNTALAGPALGHTDGFVMEFDPAGGARRWAQAHGATHPAWFSALAIGPDGAVHIAGSAMPAEDFELDRARQQLVGQSYTADGEPLWRWETPLTDRVAFGSSLSIVPGSCTADLLVAGSVAGALDLTEDGGGLDALVVAPDFIEFLLPAADD